jgi:ABC-type polar amino acid transport system ATPase subunit
VISIRKLVKRHGDRQALAGVDVEIGAGETVAVVGPSGGGKTTLLRCLNALEDFDEGSIAIAGFELAPKGAAMSPQRLAELRTKVGMVFQELHLFSHLTVLDNVTLAPRVVKGESAERAEATAKRLLEQVGLGDRGGAYPHQLSGGQKQRVAIARALAQAPDVLLMDEPTSALDPETTKAVARMVVELTRGRVTVVVVTHQLDLATAMAARILRLEHGRLAGSPPPDHRVAESS